MKKQVVIEDVTDPAEIAAARAQRERSDRNAAFLDGHAKEVYTRHRGRCVCVAGEELFVADTPEEAMALAKSAHPEDDGSFMRYIPREKLARIYAHRR
jgi:prepilin-type processing-associated H-X9-DG protein